MCSFSDSKQVVRPKISVAKTPCMLCSRFWTHPLVDYHILVCFSAQGATTFSNLSRFYCRDATGMMFWIINDSEELHTDSWNATAPTTVRHATRSPSLILWKYVQTRKQSSEGYTEKRKTKAHIGSNLILGFLCEPINLSNKRPAHTHREERERRWTCTCWD